MCNRQIARDDEEGKKSRHKIVAAKSLAESLGRVTPWQAVLQRAAGGQALQQELKISKWPQAICLGSLHDGIDGGAGIGSSGRIAEQPVFAANGKGPDSPFRAIIG